MSPATPGAQGRGFFFDLGPLTDEGKSEVESQSPNMNMSHESNIAKNRLNGTSPSREWWGADAKLLLTPTKSSARPAPKMQDGPPPISQFELNLPEHLPNSPLCPKNPTHTSGGTGICVYHGRKRSVGLKRRADTPESSSGMNESR
jgi:parafibromin